jgi:hypothetical protein
MRRLRTLLASVSDIMLGYAPAFFTAGALTYRLDPVSQVLAVIMLTVAYVLRAPQVGHDNYAAFLAGYFTAAAAGFS